MISQLRRVEKIKQLHHGKGMLTQDSTELVESISANDHISCGKSASFWPMGCGWGMGLLHVWGSELLVPFMSTQKFSPYYKFRGGSTDLQHNLHYRIGTGGPWCRICTAIRVRKEMAALHYKNKCSWLLYPSEISIYFYSQWDVYLFSSIDTKAHVNKPTILFRGKNLTNEA